jgi:hypothetical protein
MSFFKDKSEVKLELNPLTKSIVEQLIGGGGVKMSSPRGEGNRITIAFDPVVDEDPNQSKEKPSLVKSIKQFLDGKDEITRLAFESDPSRTNVYQGLYRTKMRLLPDWILKRISIQDDLVATIINARQNQMSAFGRALEDQFGFGFAIEPKKGVLDNCSEEQSKELQDRIEKATELLVGCGNRDGWGEEDRQSFVQWLYMSTRYALVVGRCATEVIWVDTLDGEKKFHSFRVIDAGTIYRCVGQRDSAQQVREEARFLLEQIKNKKLVPEKYLNDEYTWIQVIEGTPKQAFTSKECLVWNFYPCADIELDGYPVTPIDTMLSAVTTHINITTHNKLYFQSGRATRGMLVIKSADADANLLAQLRQQFNASINNVNNAWRMPVFGLNPEDDLQWQPIDTGTRDMEFQYLTDMNARVILSAFQMSPEELPGWSYLSRGTNNQALSESNNEYQLEAHRDLGIRPLIKQFEDYINTCVFPLLDANLAKLCRVSLKGLDAETPEKKDIRIQQGMGIHMTTNDILEEVEKDPIPKELCGDILLNPQWQALVDKFVNVGVIMEMLMGIKGASKDPALAYKRDPFWFQWQQMVMMMQQQAQQAAIGGQPSPDGGGGDGGGAPTQDVPTENQKTQAVEESSAAGSGQDLTRALDQAIGLLAGGDLTKAEKDLPPSKRKLLNQHRKLVQSFLTSFDKDSESLMKEILKVADKNVKN